MNPDAAMALVDRVVPDLAAHFVVEELTQSGDKDAFEIESKGDEIVLQTGGTHGVSGGNREGNRDGYELVLKNKFRI